MTMIDMRLVTIPKSDQLNADDLIGTTKTIRVTGVSKTSAPDQPIAISFDGDGGKPYKPCKSMRRVLMQAWGIDGAEYAGRSMTLYRDEAVKFGGADVGGIRISHLSHISAPMTMALTVTRASRKPFKVLPLKVEDAPADDKVTAAVNTLIARISEADMDGLQAITAEAKVVKQREWLAANRPELAERVDVAVSMRLAAFDSPADDFPGVVTAREDAA